MRSRGTGLAKEDSMIVDGAILTANNHGDKFQCNTEVARKSFDSIKEVIMEAPNLISPYYSKEFHIISFASEEPLQLFYCKQMKKAQSIQWNFLARP